MKMKRGRGSMTKLKCTSIVSPKKPLDFKQSEGIDPMQHKLCGFVEVVLSPSKDSCLLLNSQKFDVCKKHSACSAVCPDEGAGSKSYLGAEDQSSAQLCCLDCPNIPRAGMSESDGQIESNLEALQNSMEDLHGLTTSSSKMLSTEIFEKVEQLIGKECWLSEERPELYAYFASGLPFVLVPPSSNKFCSENKAEASSSEVITSQGSSTCYDAEDVCFRTLSTVHHSSFNNFTSSVSSAGKSRKTSRVGLQSPLRCRHDDGKKSRVGKTCIEAGNIIRQLHRLSLQNKIRVQGRIIKVVQKSNKIRMVTLLDVYLPSALWSVHNYWKPGTVAASALSHLRCDWDYRKKVFEMAMNGNVGNKEYDIRMWEVGECHVLDCKSHYDISKIGKHDEFNLHKVFKSLPSYEKKMTPSGTYIQPDSVTTQGYGLHHLSDDILSFIFSQLQPRDLNSIAAACRHTRYLARNIMPCLNLKLFPHQQAAVCWMLQREINPQSFKNPLYNTLQTEDGFYLFLNCISGELLYEKPPEVMDFRGGFFCDEPGLGKTVTALSLILRTQGKLAQPPPGVQVRWCERKPGEKLGYYEFIHGGSLGLSMLKRCNALKSEELDIPDNGTVYFEDLSEDDIPLSRLHQRFRFCEKVQPLSSSKVRLYTNYRPSINCVKLSQKSNMSGISSRKVKRNLIDSFGEVETSMLDSEQNSLKHIPDSPVSKKKRSVSHVVMVQSHSACRTGLASALQIGELKSTNKKSVKSDGKEEFWAQCDGCKKWRKLPTEMSPPMDGLAWFCIMNKDVAHQSCSVPEEKWNRNESIQHLPGFRKIWMTSGQVQNVAFFMNILKDHAELLNLEAIKALNWLASLTTNKLTEMAQRGVSVPPTLRLVSVSGEDDHLYDKLFSSFGLVQSLEVSKGATWRYPDGLDQLVFDTHALKIALSKPIKKVTCLYLSKATLIIVPTNLVEHWENQIVKHTKPGQLHVYVWNDQKRPPLAHSIAWDYDIVITTFSRLSAEWSSRKDSLLMHVHWSRIILDEGHTLGASMSLTNKLQMAISMHACFRWVLTGTPMPNTPNSQLAHLHPLLKFLHEEVYGKNQRWWDQGILRPFEAGQEDGRVRLLQLLQRSMISARKSDLHNIPPCIRKVKLLDFTVKHAASYNELVETVRRNILLADWNDPDHVESLLNPRQWKFRSSTLRNVRLSCCVAGHIKMRNAGEDIQETMDILVQQGVNPMSSEFAVIKMALLDGGICNRCSQWCRLPILTPCRHLLCFSCVAIDCTKCSMPGCQHAYKMQSPKDLARPENPNPKWPVPQDLIELQPSYVQDDWHPEWHATSSSKVTYLLEQLKLLEGSSIQGLFPSSSYNNGNYSYKRHCFRYSVKENEDMACQVGSDDCMHKDVPEKVIIFSQFLEHINVVEKQLTEAGIRYVGMYSPMQSTNKMLSLMTFKNDPLCTVLLMDGSAALGLDLSFVTRVYLMEPIWDRSMEEQVVSRAHRMGATRPVLVETLAMRGTIEEQMLEFLQDSDTHHSALNHAIQGNKKHHTCQRTSHDPAESWYLEHLSFVRTHSCKTEN